MAKLNFVKSARKDNSAVKKGESYYWWAFMQGGRGGPKHYSATKPRRSQLTQSEYYGTLYDIQDNADAANPEFDDLESEIASIVSDLESLRDETQEKFYNMPEGSQQGDSGQLLESRVSSLEDAISTLESVDVSGDFGEIEGDELEEAQSSRAAEIWNEVTDALGGIE